MSSPVPSTPAGNSGGFSSLSGAIPRRAGTDPTAWVNHQPDPAPRVIAPLCIDLYCGLGGWAAGFLAEGWRVIGFDIERHDHGTGVYPGQLVLQDVLTLHGSQFRAASLIAASPPCQAYSYRAMPWKRAKGLPAPDNALFDAAFRIQKEASEAAGRYIPLIVENVRGAQAWVGAAKWHYGSYYLWGDVPALMPEPSGRKGVGGWFGPAEGRGDPREASTYSLRSEAIKQHGSGRAWFDQGFTRYGSRSERRKAASAEIAKIPPGLAEHIARVFKP